MEILKTASGLGIYHSNQRPWVNSGDVLYNLKKKCLKTKSGVVEVYNFVVSKS